MKKTIRHVPSFFYLLALALIFSSCLPGASANPDCPCDDLDYCVEWVSEGSVSLQWGQIETVEVNDVLYTLRSDDFNEDLDAALISIEKEGVVKKEFLFLDVYDRMSFEWDNEILVLLTDITEDSYKTPSAKIEVYSRGLPEISFEFEGSSETIQGVEVSSEQYAPGEEKQIDLKVENTGDAWIEQTVLEIDTGDMRVRDRGEFQLTKDGLLRKSIGCFEVDETIELNFTVVAPEWDGKTSPYALNYSVNTTASGVDIKGNEHLFTGSLNLTCTDPDLKVVMELTKEEVNMTTWYLNKVNKESESYTNSDFEIRDAVEFVFLRTKVFNSGLYGIEDLDIQFAEIPDDFAISEVYESGEPSSMDADGQYYLGQKLVPIRSGEYTFEKVMVSADFFGENLSWESETQKLIVHGPHIVLSKNLSGSGTDYSVTLELFNDGDRPAWINVTDTIPSDLNYVSGSVEKTLAGSSLPLSEWDLSVSGTNDEQSITVDGVLLPPGSTLSFGYDFSSDTTPDLPPAVSKFRAIGDYEGEVESSFFVNGKEITQSWKPLKGGWVYDEDAVERARSGTTKTIEEDESGEETFFSSNEEITAADTSDISVEAKQGFDSESILSSILGPIGSFFETAQQFVSNTFGGALNGISSVFQTVENGAIDAVENYLYAIVIVIAIAVFAIVSTLIAK